MTKSDYKNLVDRHIEAYFEYMDDPDSLELRNEFNRLNGMIWDYDLEFDGDNYIQGILLPEAPEYRIHALFD